MKKASGVIGNHKVLTIFSDKFYCTTICPIIL